MIGREKIKLIWLIWVKNFNGDAGGHSGFHKHAMRYDVALLFPVSEGLVLQGGFREILFVL